MAKARNHSKGSGNDDSCYYIEYFEPKWLQSIPDGDDDDANEYSTLSPTGALYLLDWSRRTVGSQCTSLHARDCRHKVRSRMGTGTTD